VNTAVSVAVSACVGILVVGLLLVVARGHHRAAGAPRATVRAAAHPRTAARAPAHPRTAADVPAASDLVSDFEVSRAIGVSVAARGGPAEVDYHPLRGGDRLLQIRVLAGRAGRATMRTHRRRGRPLSHAGDEALSGDGWVLGQRAGVVVLLSQHDPGRWRVIGGLPWLLSTALNRVPVPDAGLYR
jgi:hypothetical protein